MTLLNPISPEDSYRLESKIITALIYADTENAIECFERGLEPEYFITPEYREICRVHMEKLSEGLDNCEIAPHAAAAVRPGFYVSVACNRDEHDEAWVTGDEFDRFLIRGAIMKAVEAVHVG